MSTTNSWIQPYMSPKRSACDRCRRQKLRCILPRDNPSEPCARCARLGTACARSRGGPLQLPRRPETIQTAEQSDSSTHTASATVEFEDLDVTFLWGQHGDDAVFDVGSASSVDLQDHPRTRDRFSLLNSPNLSSISNSALTLSASDGDAASGCNDPQATGRESRFARSSNDLRSSSGGSYEPLPSSQMLECDCRLAALCLDLSQRLHQCHVLSGQRPAPDTLIRPRCRPGSMPWSPELFGNALGNTSEFVSIVRSYSGVAVTSHTKAAGEGRALDAVVVLNLFSAYLQIVSIHERLLQCMCEQLFETQPGDLCAASAGAPASGDPPSPPQILPGLQIAGFPIQGGNLQAKFLVDVMMDQFATLERLLGLPSELKVTTSRCPADGGGPGLLGSDGRARRLLAAMVESGGGSNGSTSKQAQPLDSDGALCTLISLRDMIQRVYRFLRYS